MMSYRRAADVSSLLYFNFVDDGDGESPNQTSSIWLCGKPIQSDTPELVGANGKILHPPHVFNFWYED